MPRHGYSFQHPYWTESTLRPAKRTSIRDSGDPELGHLINRARVRADIKQAVMATRIGVSRVRLSQWETGKRPIPEAMIEPIKEALAPALDDIEVKFYEVWPHRGRFTRLAPARNVTEGPPR